DHLGRIVTAVRALLADDLDTVNDITAGLHGECFLRDIFTELVRFGGHGKRVGHPWPLTVTSLQPLSRGWCLMRYLCIICSETNQSENRQGRRSPKGTSAL